MVVFKLFRTEKLNRFYLYHADFRSVHILQVRQDDTLQIVLWLQEEAVQGTWLLLCCTSSWIAMGICRVAVLQVDQNGSSIKSNTL